MKALRNSIRPVIAGAFLIFISITYTMAQSDSPYVNFDEFMKLSAEVQKHRKTHLVSIEKFNEMAKQKDVIILDTRSKAQYDKKHIKGAVHLTFADFTQAELRRVVGSFDKKILIYCNNNFEDDAIAFPTKMVVMPDPVAEKNKLTLALNIPTYINLYGYGYKNVYELKELISVFDSRVEFEGTSVLKAN